MSEPKQVRSARRRGFFITDNEIHELGVSALAIACYSYLCRYAGKGEKAYLPILDRSKVWKVGRPKIRAALDELIECNVIAVVVEVTTGDKKNTPTAFLLLDKSQWSFPESVGQLAQHEDEGGGLESDGGWANPAQGAGPTGPQLILSKQDRVNKIGGRSSPGGESLPGITTAPTETKPPPLTGIWIEYFEEITGRRPLDSEIPKAGKVLKDLEKGLGREGVKNILERLYWINKIPNRKDQWMRGAAKFYPWFLNRHWADLRPDDPYTEEEDQERNDKMEAAE